MSEFHTDHISDLSVEILEAITKNLDFSVPDVNFDEITIPDALKDALIVEPEKVDIKLLTSRKVKGDGVFDAVMESISNHLMEEYRAGRITGAEYTKTYAAVLNAALQFSVQYALGKNVTYWQSLSGQLMAMRALVDLQKAKVELAIAQAQALTHKAQYAVTVARLANEEADLHVKKAQGEQIEYNIEHILPLQAQLTGEQVEATRAQTADTRTDGEPVAGSVGKQKDLYTQQIDSYKKNAQVNAAKMVVDTWTSMQQIVGGTQVPGAVNNASVQTVLESVAEEHNLGTLSTNSGTVS